MIILLAQIVEALLVLHGPDGRVIRVNPMLVTSMHAALPGTANKLYTEEVRCIVGLVDGKNISVVEPCEDIQRMMRRDRT